MRHGGVRYARWDPHRRAFIPRLWPWALLAGALAFTVTVAVTHWVGFGWYSPALGAVVGSACGFGLVYMRLAIWRARHPWRPCLGCLLTNAAIKQRETARWQ